MMRTSKGLANRLALIPTQGKRNMRLRLIRKSLLDPLVQKRQYHCPVCGVMMFISQIEKPRTFIERAAAAGQVFDTEAAADTALQWQCASFDHVIPHAWGGFDAVENGLIVCHRCNNARGHKRLSTWIKKLVARGAPISAETVDMLCQLERDAAMFHGLDPETLSRDKRARNYR